MINSVDNPVRASINECAVGSKVFAIYLRVEVIFGGTPAGGIDNIYMYVFKNPSSSLTTPPVDGIGASEDRKYVIHQEMMMTGNNTSLSDVPRTLFKGVIRIPKLYQRNGYGDKLQVVIGHRTGEATQATNFCLQCIYKEFR